VGGATGPAQVSSSLLEVMLSSADETGMGGGWMGSGGEREGAMKAAGLEAAPATDADL